MHKSQHRSLRNTERQGNTTTLGDQNSKVTKSEHIEMGKMTGEELNRSSWKLISKDTDTKRIQKNPQAYEWSKEIIQDLKKKITNIYEKFRKKWNFEEKTENIKIEIEGRFLTGQNACYTSMKS